MKPSTTISYELDARRIKWLETMRDEGVKADFPQYVSLVRHGGSLELKQEALEVMLNSVGGASRHNILLYTEVAHFAAVESWGVQMFKNSTFRPKLCVALTLFADTLLHFDYSEIDVLSTALHNLTGSKIDIDRLLLDPYALTRQVTDIFYGPLWSDLVLSDWTIDTPDMDKLSALMAAPLLPKWSMGKESLICNLPDSLDL